jgi:hypothetical protein
VQIKIRTVSNVEQLWSMVLALLRLCVILSEMDTYIKWALWIAQVKILSSRRLGIGRVEA